MTDKHRMRGRAAASIAVTAALIGAGAAVTSSPALSDVPVDNTCNEAVPVAEVQKDEVVTGLTVTDGVTPVQFDGVVLGVLEDGIAPDLDMIMARIDVAGMNVPDVDGIWAGMSGSPVYDADGGLIGAIAYGLSWGPSNVAGITPYEHMDDHLPAPVAPRVDVTSAEARQIARSSSVTRAQAEQGFSQLRLPLRAAGLTSQRIKALKASGKFRKNEYLNKKFAGVGGSISPRSSAPADLVPGGNLAASMSYGDITMGGVGTVTAVCGSDLVGFGHPATFLGDTSLTLHPAEAVYVQNDPLGAPFKVANFGEAAGTIDGDHLAGISGFVGETPETTTISSDVTWTPTGGQRTGASYVSVPEAGASTTFYEHVANHDRVLDSITPGSETLSWEITGTDEAGDPFELSFTDAYASEYDITYESAWELADLVWFLSSFPGVSLDSVSSTSVVDDDASTYRITDMEQRRAGEWVRVTRRKEAVVDAGDTLVLRATMATASGETKRKKLLLDVPKGVSRRGYVYVEGGGYSYLDVWGADSVDEIAEAVAEGVRGDEIQATLYVRGGGERRIRTHSDPADKVVVGGRSAEVRIRR